MRFHVTVPFDRMVKELNIPMRGMIAPGAFVTARTRPSPGWDAPGLPVPELTSRRARLLYNSGVIVPKPKQIEQKKKVEVPIGRK